MYLQSYMTNKPQWKLIRKAGDKKYQQNKKKLRHRKDTLTKRFFLTSTENVTMTKKEKNAHKLDSFTLAGDATLRLHCPEDGLQNMQLTLFY